jgi:D-glycero-alpha-D-manno-heptose 1-phosphate guanylyltransferase
MNAKKTKLTEAIVLAGGLGTRLRGVVQDVPKCLAPVCDVPFLDYVLRYAHRQGISRFVLSVGYKYEMIQDFVAEQKYPFEIDYCIETKPLGTGGAIKKSLRLCKTNHVLVLNGDTMFAYDISKISLSDCAIFLKPMIDFDRYGSVQTDEKGRIVHFREKQNMKSGLINTGAYIIERKHIDDLPLPEKFSFEKDYLEHFVSDLKFIGIPLDAYFIDIGIPEDYQKAQIELVAFKHRS